MSYGKMVKGKTHPHVGFEKDTTEFIPYVKPPSPARTASSSESLTKHGVFLDEIALIKRNMIPRQATLKNRKMGVVLSQQEKSRSAPISLEELKGRGIRMENGEVIYTLPSANKSKSARTASSSESLTKHGVFLDEIALMKRHMIPRQATLKNRKMGVVLSQQEKSRSAPISLEELKGRGIRMENVEVIYTIPSANKSSTAWSPRSYSRSKSSNSSCSSVRSSHRPARSSNSASSVQSRATMFEPAWMEKEFAVGIPSENARLKVCKLKNGERYELIVNGNTIALEMTDKHSILVAHKE